MPKLTRPPLGVMTKLGKRIRAARDSKELSQSQLGLDASTVSRIERGLAPNARAADIVRIAQRLEVRLGWLFEGEQPAFHNGAELLLVGDRVALKRNPQLAARYSRVQKRCEQDGPTRKIPRTKDGSD